MPCQARAFTLIKGTPPPKKEKGGEKTEKTPGSVVRLAIFKTDRARATQTKPPRGLVVPLTFATLRHGISRVSSCCVQPHKQGLLIRTKESGHSRERHCSPRVEVPLLGALLSPGPGPAEIAGRVRPRGGGKIKEGKGGGGFRDAGRGWLQAWVYRGRLGPATKADEILDRTLLV